MRCSCGKPGAITLPQREFPYCQSCFEQRIRERVRREAGSGPVVLLNHPGYFLDAAKAVCALARREVTFVEPADLSRAKSSETKPLHALEAGCAETAAAAVLARLLGRTEQTTLQFPASVTLEELQMFFKPTTPVILEPVAEELRGIERRYPGTIASIIKQNHQNTQTTNDETTRASK